MRRREFIAGIASASLPHAAYAQQVNSRVWRIGFLGSAAPTPEMISALREGLRERGYIEGNNLILDIRWLMDDNPNVAAELVRSGVDLVVAWATQAAVAASRATSTIPIVMVSVADPLRSGLAVELARPGRNVTGTSNMATELSGKLVNLLVQIVPGTKHIGVVRNPGNLATSTASLKETMDVSRALGLRTTLVDAESVEDFERAFATLSDARVDGVVMLPDAILVRHRAKIAEIAKNVRLPTAFQRRENAEAGGLLAYGSDLSDLLRQSSRFVDRIFKGAKPAELPVEQPTKFTLVVNLKTAKAIGVSIPPTLLASADEVIE
ncbi:MAG: ABC transporter substrate-binding protein [Beijerinckiaceae bacterium]